MKWNRIHSAAYFEILMSVSHLLGICVHETETSRQQMVYAGELILLEGGH